MQGFAIRVVLVLGDGAGDGEGRGVLGLGGGRIGATAWMARKIMRRYYTKQGNVRNLVFFFKTTFMYVIDVESNSTHWWKGKKMNNNNESIIDFWGWLN